MTVSNGCLLLELAVRGAVTLVGLCSATAHGIHNFERFRISGRDFCRHGVTFVVLVVGLSRPGWYEVFLTTCAAGFPYPPAYPKATSLFNQRTIPKNPLSTRASALLKNVEYAVCGQG